MDEDKESRRKLLVLAPVVVATIYGRTVWAATIQTAGSACGSACPSTGAVTRLSEYK